MTAKRKQVFAGKTGIKVNIKPGPASPAQKAAWRRFWAKLITKANLRKWLAEAMEKDGRHRE